MKRKDGFVMRKVGERWVVVAVGEESKHFNGMVRMNDSGAFLYRQLEQEKTKEELALAMVQEYGIDEATAAKGVDNFLEAIADTGILED